MRRAKKLRFAPPDFATYGAGLLCVCPRTITVIANSMHRLRNRILPLAVAGGLLFPAGCSLSGQHQLEANLRQSEASIRDLQHQLADSKQLLRDQEDELLALRQSTDEPPFHTTSSSRTLETAVAWGAVEKLRIHSFASGILRTGDGQLAVNVIVQPLDRDGEIVKVAGELTIQLQQPGETTLLAETTITSLESRRAWTNGMIGRGFQIKLPLAGESLESGSQVLVTATLNLTPDRQFKATRLMPVPE